MLKQYNGSLLDIGMAEQFLLHLADIPDYHTLLLGHQVRVEFSANMAQVKKALRTMALACSFILDSADLRDLLQLVLKLGNFLNQVSLQATTFEISRTMRKFHHHLQSLPFSFLFFFLF